MLGVSFVLCSAFAGVVWGQSIPENPCPDVFAYRRQGGIYYGDIAVAYDGSKNLNLGVNISMAGLYQNMVSCGC
jgi:hypothetical protein